MGALPAGWPTLPRIPCVQHRITEAVINRTPLAPYFLAQARSCGSHGAHQVQGTIEARGYQFDEAARLAARFYSAQQIQASLERLEAEEAGQRIRRIEDCAQRLLPKIFVGEEDPGALYSHGAINAEQLELLYKDRKALTNFLPLLYVSELSNPEMIKRLAEDADARTRLVEARANLPEDPAVPALKELLFAEWETLNHLTREAFLFDFWRAAHDKEVIWAEKCLTHDTRRSFGFLFGHWKFHRSNCALPFWLHGLRHLGAHLQHYISVLSVARARLVGEQIPSRLIRFSDLVQTSAIAGGFRLKLPLNFSLPAKEGHINCFAEEGLCTSLVFEYMELVLYNCIKNIEEAAKHAKKPLSEITITVRAGKDQQFPQVYTISIEDNCDGFNLNCLMAEAENASQDLATREIMKSLPAFRVLALWGEKPNIIRNLTVGNVFDFSLIPRLSGWQANKLSSGVGLAEAAEFAQQTGMKIMLTNTARGGALITFLFGDPAQVEAVISRELQIS